MSNNNLNSTKNRVWIPEIIANQALGALGGYLNLGKTVAKDSDLTTAQEGQIIHVPKRGALTAQQKTENGDILVQNPTGTDVEVVLDQHWHVAVGEEDFTRSLQIGSTLPGYVEDGVIVLGEKIETALANRAHDLTHSIVAGLSSNTPFEDMIDVRADLIGRKVPKLATRYAYLHPDFVANLLKQEAVLDPKVGSGERALTEGAIGRIAGFDTFEGQLVAEDGSPAKKQNLFYLRNAFVLATRPLLQPDGLGVQASTLQDENGLAIRVIRAYDPKQMAVIISLDVLFGTAVLDDRLATVLES